jgi:hypothetical protein
MYKVHLLGEKINCFNLKLFSTDFFPRNRQKWLFRPKRFGSKSDPDPQHGGGDFHNWPWLRRQEVGSSLLHWMGPFSAVWTPDITPLAWSATHT